MNFKHEKSFRYVDSNKFKHNPSNWQTTKYNKHIKLCYIKDLVNLDLTMVSDLRIYSNNDINQPNDFNSLYSIEYILQNTNWHNIKKLALYIDIEHSLKNIDFKDIEEIHMYGYIGKNSLNCVDWKNIKILHFSCSDVTPNVTRVLFKN